jgi:O-acetyl-ADP-ribose deacetylase (regulator of RNase III)
MRPRIFVGSSREGIEVCRAVQLDLADDCDVTVWDQDVFRLSYGALDSLLDALDSSDAGIFVLRPDDFTISRDVQDTTVRDNVIFELGMFIGRLGRDRTFMLVPRGANPRLPSDLLGLTTASYAVDRPGKRAAVGPACTKIRDQLAHMNLRVVEEPSSRGRLDRAMGRMSRDLEYLLSIDQQAHSGAAPAATSLQLGRAKVDIEIGRIQDYAVDDARGVVALPANEYFDDECVTDRNSSLGAFVQHHFADRLEEFLGEVQAETAGLPSQRVPRAERRIDDSYGIGQALYLRAFAPEHQVILVSATTERASIGLRAEPHFLYAAIQGAVETMNEHRLNALTMPVLGSGHGGMPLAVALLFNLLALRSVLSEDTGRHVRHVRIIVFERAAARDLTGETLREIVRRVDS